MEKKLKLANPFYHIFFWLATIAILTLIFGRSWGSGLNAFFFISMLLPVVMGTSYFFNFYLVPGFLFQKRYFFFGLYLVYMVIVSLYLQMLVVFFSFIYLANLHFAEMGVHSGDVYMLAAIMYLIVFAGSFWVLLQQLAERQKELEVYREEEAKRKNAFLELLSNRQLVRIPYDDILFIESLSDYIQVHCEKLGKVSSKEKISTLAEILPVRFVRIHRSFVVNADKVTKVNANEIYLNEIQLNIGRTYKKDVANFLKTS